MSENMFLICKIFEKDENFIEEKKSARSRQNLRDFAFLKKWKGHFRFNPTGIILKGSNYENPNLWGILSAFYCTYLNSLHELLQLTAASSGCLRHVLLYLPTKRIVNMDFQLFIKFLLFLCASYAPVVLVMCVCTVNSALCRWKIVLNI